MQHIASPRQAGASSEIEITSEMVEAGAELLMEYAILGPYSARWLAEAVFVAMMHSVADQASEKVSLQQPKSL